MSDTIQLSPSVPVVSRPAQVRPDQHVEAAQKPQSDNQAASNGSNAEHHGGQPTRHLTVSRHDTLGVYVYRSIDEGSGDVLWQYPAENILRMAQQWQEKEDLKTKHQIDEKA